METQSSISPTEPRPTPTSARAPACAPQGELSARVVDSLSAFSDAELDRVTEGSGIFFDRRWYRLLDGLELGQLVRAPVSFHYVVVSRGGVPAAICPFFITRDPSVHYAYSFDKSFFTSWQEDLGRINPSMASVARWTARIVDGIRRAARLAGVHTDTWLVAASPLSFRGSISVAALPDVARRQALDAAIAKLKEASEAEGAPIWFYRIPDEERALRASLAEAGFDETFALYEAFLDDLEGGIPGFLGRFRSDPRRHRRREIEKVQRIVRFETTRDIAGLEPEITTLYEATYAKFGPERFAQPPSFWSDVCRHLGPQAEFILARRGANLVGFSLLLHKQRDLWFYRVGKLEGEDEIPLLYFSLGCYEPVRRAAALGARRLWLGPGAWETKHHRGAAGYALHNAFYFPGRWRRAALLPYLRLFSSVTRGQLEFVTKPSESLKPVTQGKSHGVHSMIAKRLIIIGAGPKAMAVAAKAHVLAELGFPVPKIQIIERRRVGAHWTGDSGYTNGLVRLSTSPEKDIGFPYQSTCWVDEEMNRAINARMMRFSWQSFLVERDLFAEWVDRGRPAPEHRRWAEYLQWVAQGVSGSVAIQYGEVQRISVKDGRWLLSYRSPEGRTLGMEGEGLMLTGPGQTNATVDAPRHDRVLTIEDFWIRHRSFRSMDAARIAVVGSGETAAAIAMELAGNGNRALRVDIISPIGMTYSRGESYRENRLYSNPEIGRWKLLSEEDRRRFIHRTDQGVFSLASQEALDQAENLDIVPGRLHRVTVNSGGRVELTLDYDQGRHTYSCDHVVLAMGYDHLAPLRGMLDDEARREILGQTGLREITDRALESIIEPHFEVRGLTPRLHLPMLSRLTQGPGFANLSCLGCLSDSVLTAYVARVDRRAARPERAAPTPRLAAQEPTWALSEARLGPPRSQPASSSVP